jgi:hypothetical protein
MQLKKELVDQSMQIKQQRDQLMTITIERDNAIAELKLLREEMATGAAAAPTPVTSSTMQPAIAAGTASTCAGVKTRAAVKLTSNTEISASSSSRTKDLVASYAKKYLDQSSVVVKKQPLGERDINESSVAVLEQSKDLCL